MTWHLPFSPLASPSSPLVQDGGHAAALQTALSEKAALRADIDEASRQMAKLEAELVGECRRNGCGDMIMVLGVVTWQLLIRLLPFSAYGVEQELALRERKEAVDRTDNFKEQVDRLYVDVQADQTKVSATW